MNGKQVMEKAKAIGKAHWLPIACVVVGVGGLAASVVVSGGMNKALVKRVQETVSADVTALDQSRVTYDLPSPGGDGNIVEESLVANRVINEFFRDVRAKQQASVADVAQLAIGFNKGDKAPLIEGLFPEPPLLEREIAPRNFARRLGREAHAELLARAKAGTPQPAELLRDLLVGVKDAEERARVTIGPDGSRELGEEARREIDRVLAGRLVDQVRRRAAELSFYADTGVFAPAYVYTEGTTITLEEAWKQQQVLWVQGDVVLAVERANGVSRGLGVSAGIVKRIDRIEVVPVEAPAAAPAGGEAGGGGDPALGAGVASGIGTVVGQDAGASVSGRVGGGASNYFDMFEVTVTGVFDAAQLPGFFEALAKTNFVTVLGVRTEPVDQLADLRAGFYYGEGPVVRATLRLESLLLREWMRPWMPPGVRQRLGVVDEPPPESVPTDQPL